MVEAGGGTASSNMYKIQKQNEESPSMESKMLANAKPPYYRKGKHDQESRSNSKKKKAPSFCLCQPSKKPRNTEKGNKKKKRSEVGATLLLKSAFFLHRLGWYVPTFLKRYRHNEEGTHTHIKKTESASEHVEIKFERYLGHYNTRQLAAAQNAHATQLEVAPERKKKNLLSTPICTLSSDISFNVPETT